MPKYKRVKNVPGVAKEDSYRSERAKIQAIDFQRAWLEARNLDPTLPPNPPKDASEETQKAIINLARKILLLSLEWS